MIILNFSHPLTPPQLTQIEALTGSAISEVRGEMAKLNNALPFGQQVREIVERVGLSSRMNHRPQQLSGGERQRVAVARALFHKPSLLFADEPTGNLDEETGHDVMTLIRETCQETDSHLVLVTHNRKLIADNDQVLTLEHGKAAAEEVAEEVTTA